MESTRTGSRASRVALGAALIVAFLTLAGCGTPNPSPPHAPPTPTSQDTSSTYTIEETTDGFIYKDAPSGYAITFPQRPDVEPLAHNETDQPANFVSTELASGEFVSIGQVLNKEPNLRAQLMGFVQSLKPSGQVSASSYTLGGLDAAQAQFTTGDDPSLPSSLVGQPGVVVVAGDGNRFYSSLRSAVPRTSARHSSTRSSESTNRFGNCSNPPPARRTAALESVGGPTGPRKGRLARTSP